jgi:hypothetical protein
MAGNGTSTTYTDTNLAFGTIYTYTVAALNEAGAGPESNTASASPGAPPISDAEKKTPEIALQPNGSGGCDAKLTLKNSVIGHSYRLQSSDDLSAGSWHAIPNVSSQAGTGSDLQFIVPLDPVKERQFLRIVIYF